MRIGIGYDVHKFAAGRELIIGGVNIPHEAGLLGHSDADVLLHAIADALLGAAALGDIGKLYPDSAEEFAGIDSRILLADTAKRVRQAGYEIGNIDSIIIAQAPKMAPHIDAMRENIAESLGIEKGRVSVKATTEEGLGFTGAKLGIAAQATALIE
ncbi:MAG: 2-C-methyl-D-erythritol 2,4-cyclodiphosphate synthase [Acutalibacteraceae bacterium]